jgi:uncharacterized membrane protein
MSVRGAVLIAATISTGLMAGVFYAFACSVLPGLRRVDDRTFIDAMQRINVAIVNGWFLVIFLGALALTGLAAALHLRGAGRSALWWIVAGFLLYAVAFVITFAANIPLNDRLAAAGDPDRIDDLGAVRAQFEAAWTRWHLIRTAANTAAFGCLVWALVQYGRTMAPGAG